MRNKTKYVLLFGFILAFSSCQEKEPAPENETLASEIFLTAGTPATKGFIEDQTAFENSATIIKVYDFVTDGTAEGKYIDDSIHGDIAEDGTWAYSAQDTHYHWTKKGTHKFFGWLTTDPDGTAFASAPTWTESSKTLSIASLTMTKNTPQFDFLYSDIVTRDSADPTQHGPIKLEMKHLFSALAVNLENIGEDVINVQSVSVAGVNNTKSAVVQFKTADGTTSVNYSAVSSGNFLTATITNPRLEQNNKINLYTGRTWTENTPILMWPQDATEIENAEITVTYTMDGYEDPENPGQLKVVTKTVKLNESSLFRTGGMEAGKKYIITLQFKGTTIDLNLVVMPWDYNTYDLDYSASTIQAWSGTDNDGVLWLYTVGADGIPHAGDRNRLITMESGEFIKGTFRILSPRSGEWQITTYPAEAAQYFVIRQKRVTVVNETEVVEYYDSNSGSIGNLVDSFGNYTGLVEFYIFPVGVVPYQQELHFNVDIMINGAWRNANSEFNRKDWRLYREP